MNILITGATGFLAGDLINSLCNSENTLYCVTQKSEKANLYNITPKVIRLLKNSVSDAADEDGWAFLGDVGSLILKKQPNFDSRNFGFEKLTPLFKSLDAFDLEQRDKNNSRFKLIYVKNK